MRGSRVCVRAPCSPTLLGRRWEAWESSAAGGKSAGGSQQRRQEGWAATARRSPSGEAKPTERWGERSGRPQGPLQQGFFFLMGKTRMNGAVATGGMDQSGFHLVK